MWPTLCSSSSQIITHVPKHMHACSHTLKYRYTHTHLYTLIQAYIHAHTCPCTHNHVQTQMFIYTHLHICSFTHIHICVHPFTFTYILSHAHAHTYTLMYIHPYTHMCSHTFMYTHVHRQSRTDTQTHSGTCTFMCTQRHAPSLTPVHTGMHPAALGCSVPRWAAELTGRWRAERSDGGGVESHFHYLWQDPIFQVIIIIKMLLSAVGAAQCTAGYRMVSRWCSGNEVCGATHPQTCSKLSQLDWRGGKRTQKEAEGGPGACLLDSVSNWGQPCS